VNPLPLTHLTHTCENSLTRTLQVPKLSQNAQAIIRRYTSHVRDLPPAAALAALLTQTLPWPTPSLDDYHALLKESEYAAWYVR
jgi:hypothetical protein